MQIENNVQETQQDLFSQDDLFPYADASTGQRFFNYLIDIVLIQFALGFVTGYLYATILVSLAPDVAYSVFSEEQTFVSFLINYLLASINFIIYYTLCEKAFNGYTLGKLITGTKAIRQDGEALTFKDALLRSLCRLVPFEPLSIWIGDGVWHDRWTKTTVVKTR